MFQLTCLFKKILDIQKIHVTYKSRKRKQTTQSKHGQKDNNYFNEKIHGLQMSTQKDVEYY